MTYMWDFSTPKKKYIFNNQEPPYRKVCFGIRGQYGDVIMQEPGLREFIKNNPDTKIVFAVSKKYEDILPLFYNYHENIIEYKAWEGYDDWPTPVDLEYINSQGFDALFPPATPVHAQPDWAKYRHQTTETALMIGVNAPTTIDITLKMPPEVVKEPKTVALHLFSSKWPGGTRSLGIEKQTAIVNFITSRGYKVYQLSAPHQPHIENTIFQRGTYYESCKRMLASELLITCDSGMPWVASAYNHPMIGLYSFGYNSLIQTTKNWQPFNPNAVYLEAFLANNIPLDDILIEINKKITRK